MNAVEIAVLVYFIIALAMWVPVALNLRRRQMKHPHGHDTGTCVTVAGLGVMIWPACLALGIVMCIVDKRIGKDRRPM